MKEIKKEIKDIIVTLEGLDIVMENLYVGVEKFKLNSPKEIRPMPYGMDDLVQYLYVRLYDEDTAEYTRISIPKDVCGDTEFLWNAAMENTIKESGYIQFSTPMFALTNGKVNGASAILCPGILEEIARKARTNKFVAFPSSIHEFLLFPVDEQPTEEEIAMHHEMVRSTNMEAVAPNERLVDHAYYIEI